MISKLPLDWVKEGESDLENWALGQRKVLNWYTWVLGSQLSCISKLGLEDKGQESVWGWYWIKKTFQQGFTLVILFIFTAIIC